MNNRINLFRHQTVTRHVDAGSTIFQAGDPFDHAYVIQSGTVHIVQAGQQLRTLEAGEIFGELALINATTRCAAAIAATDCELVAISKSQFYRLLDYNRSFTLTVMRMLAERISEPEAH